VERTVSATRVWGAHDKIEGNREIEANRATQRRLSSPRPFVQSAMVSETTAIGSADLQPAHAFTWGYVGRVFGVCGVLMSFHFDLVASVQEPMSLESRHERPQIDLVVDSVEGMNARGEFPLPALFCVLVFEIAKPQVLHGYPEIAHFHGTPAGRSIGAKQIYYLIVDKQPGRRLGQSLLMHLPDFADTA
jgi:hypothetical protein